MRHNDSTFNQDSKSCPATNGECFKRNVHKVLHDTLAANYEQAMNSQEEVEKVHDTYLDEEDTNKQSPESPDKDRRPSINGAINHARPRPAHIPRPVSQSYPTFKGKQECALMIGIHQTFDQEIGNSATISHMEIGKDKLTIYYRSQSKLSQQELQDLQKATHFDKKELQQWYKGTHLRVCENKCGSEQC